MSKSKDLAIALATGIAAALIILWLAAMLTGCSKETSFECSACQTTTDIYQDGKPVSRQIKPVDCGNIPRDTIYFINPRLVVITKTVCK